MFVCLDLNLPVVCSPESRAAHVYSSHQVPGAWLEQPKREGNVSTSKSLSALLNEAGGKIGLGFAIVWAVGNLNDAPR